MVTDMGDNLDNIRMLDAKVGNRKMFLLWPGVLALLFLFVLLFAVTRTGMEGEDVSIIWRMYGFWIGLYMIVGIIMFLISRTGPDISIRSMTPEEQARVNVDCLVGYRFGSIIICRDCLLIPASGARVSAVHYRDLLWIYTDKRWIRYATRKNGMINAVPKKDKFFPKNLGPQLDEEGFYNIMQQFLPWCFFRKTPEVETMFRRNFPQMIRAVDERRAAYFASQPFMPNGNMHSHGNIQ